MRCVMFLLFWCLCTHAVSNTEDVSLYGPLAKVLGDWRLVSSSTQKKLPNMIMINRLSDDGLGVTVTLYEVDADKVRKPILFEYLTFDQATQKIHVLANSGGKVFRGEGVLLDDGNLMFNDFDMTGKPTINVKYDFISDNAYILTGFQPDGKKIWSYGYERIANP